MKNTNKIKHFLGIDFGAAKVGLSLADGETKLAFSYKTIKNDKNILIELGEIISKENVATVIIGIPSYIIKTQEEYDQKSLGKLLESNTGVKVYYAEEMFTSKMAQINLREKGEKMVGKNDDKEAARIILQSWLDKEFML